MSDLVANLRRWMAHRGLTQVELARRADLDVRTIKLIMAGSSERPHPRTVHKLALGLEVSTDQLMCPLGEPRVDFDRVSNPVVDEVLADCPHLCQEWTAEDFAELYGHFGTGGALTYDGARQMMTRIQRKRETLDRAALLLETDCGDLLIEFVDMLHRRTKIDGAVHGSVERCEVAAE